MTRLYRCPPDLAGDYEAAYVIKPLARWSRHRELLAAAMRRRRYSPRAHREAEMARTVAVCFGILGVLGGILGVFYVSQTTRFVIPAWASASLWAGAILPLLAFLAWMAEPLFWRGRARGGVAPENRAEWEELYLAGLDFRGATALVAGERALMTSQEVWRLRWGWPSYLALWPVFLTLWLPLRDYQTAGIADLLAGAGGFAGWFIIFNTLFLALRAGMPFQSVGWTLRLFDPALGRERTRFILSKALALTGWTICAWVGCWIALKLIYNKPELLFLMFAAGMAFAWTASARHSQADPFDKAMEILPGETLQDYYQRLREWRARDRRWNSRQRELLSTLFWIWLASWFFLPAMAPRGYLPSTALAIALLLMRSLWESLLIAGDPRSLRQTLRQGEKAFRDWIQAGPPERRVE